MITWWWGEMTLWLSLSNILLLSLQRFTNLVSCSRNFMENWLTCCCTYTCLYSIYTTVYTLPKPIHYQAFISEDFRKSEDVVYLFRLRGKTYFVCLLLSPRMWLPVSRPPLLMTVGLTPRINQRTFISSRRASSNDLRWHMNSLHPSGVALPRLNLLNEEVIKASLSLSSEIALAFKIAKK